VGVVVGVVYLLEFLGSHYAECVLFSCFQQSHGFLRFKNEDSPVFFLVIAGCCGADQGPEVLALL